MNNSTATRAFVLPLTLSSSPTVVDYQVYAYLGPISILLNLLIFIILSQDRNLLKKSALISGLTLGNLFLGLHLFTTAVYKLMIITELNNLTSFNYCLSIIIGFWYPLAFNTEVSFLILSSIERLLAIKAPNWFHHRWTNRNSWLITGAAICFVLITLIGGLFWPTSDRLFMTKSCSLISMYGGTYVNFLSAFAAAGGLLSTTLTVIALIAGIVHIRHLPLASGETGRLRRQLQLTKATVTISCLDMALVVIPNILSLLANSGRVTFPWWIRAPNSSYTHGINAMLTFFVFLRFNRQFRKATIRLFRAEKLATVLAKRFGMKLNIDNTVQQPKTGQHNDVVFYKTTRIHIEPAAM